MAFVVSLSISNICITFSYFGITLWKKSDPMIRNNHSFLEKNFLKILKSFKERRTLRKQVCKNIQDTFFDIYLKKLLMAVSIGYTN